MILAGEICELSEAEGLTHVDASGEARMVDIGAKAETHRIAVASGSVHMKEETAHLIQANRVAKGDVIATARVAAIQAAKVTDELIPLCHSIGMTSMTVDFEVLPELGRLDISARAETVGRTGVEMEALVAVALAGLTIYDMCKAVDRKMMIGDIRLLRKSGGRSGDFTAE